MDYSMSHTDGHQAAAAAASSSSASKRSHPLEQEGQREENPSKRHRTRPQTAATNDDSCSTTSTPSPKVNFLRQVPKDVLLQLANSYLSDREVGSLGRASWLQLRALKSYRMKKSLSFVEMLRVVDANEREKAMPSAGNVSPSTVLHPHTHRDLRDSPIEAVAARQLAYVSMTAFRAKFAFGRPQTTHVVLHKTDLESEQQSEQEFLFHLRRLPSTLRKIILTKDVLDAMPELWKHEDDFERWIGSKMEWHPDLWADAPRPDPGHLDALCQNWPPSVTSIRFTGCLDGPDHELLPLYQWRLPPGLTELHLNMQDDFGAPPFYTLGDPLRLPATLTRLEVSSGCNGTEYDRILGLRPLSDKPPPRSAAEQLQAREMRLTAPQRRIRGIADALAARYAASAAASTFYPQTPAEHDDEDDDSEDRYDDDDDDDLALPSSSAATSSLAVLEHLRQQLQQQIGSHQQQLQAEISRRDELMQLLAHRQQTIQPPPPLGPGMPPPANAQPSPTAAAQQQFVALMQAPQPLFQPNGQGRRSHQ
jgi:hypothetical protein